ncbi:MAG TPA: ImcF-related family protein, partial [Candidatus Eisenbacteria bacterium]
PSGAAVDRVYGPAAIALGLNAGAASAPTPAAGGSWFVSDLFTKVIFPDRDMATESTQRVERRRLARVMLAASLGLVLLVLLAFFAVVSVMNGDPIDHVRREAEHLRRVSAGGAFEDRVEGIDRLRAQIVRLEGLRQHLPWWRHLGGYWGDDVIDPALQVYARHALSNLVRPALPQMDNDLAAMVASPQPAFVPAFYEYWAWRLLRKPDEMRAGDARVIAGVVRRSLASDLAGVPTAKRDAVGGMVEQDVDFLVAHEKLVAQNESVYLTPEPASLAQNAAAWLRQRWDRQAIYDDVIGRQVAAQVKPLTLAELIGRTPEPLSSDASVPGAYTREGWAKVVSPLLAWYRERLGGPWVEDVADSARVLAVDLGDRYASSYTRAWIDFLGHVKASSSPNRQTCAGLVNDITRDGSPLFALLGGAARETRFTHEPGPGIDRVQQDFEMLQGFEIAPGEARKPGFFGRIGRWFGGLFGKKKSAGGTFDTMSSDKQNYVRQLGVLATKVQALAQPSAASQAYNEIFISLSPTELCQVDQFKASAQALIDKHRGHPGNDATVRALWLPLTTLAQVGPIPDPPRDVAAPPTPVVAGGVAPARAFLPPDVNAKWQLEVVAAFNAKLAGKYPLSASGPDLPLADFAEFFKPGGTFWKFYDAALKPYLAEDGTPAPGAVGVVPPGLIRAVRTARDIRDAFFAVGADPALRFMVRNGPPDTVHVTARYTLAWIDFEVGGQKPVHYTMGAATWNPLTWPGPQPSQGAAVRASGFNMTFVAQEKEVWGLFRLLDRGVFGGTETVPRVTVHVTGGKDVWSVPLEFQLEGESPKHPFRRNFLRFQLPPSI